MTRTPPAMARSTCPAPVSSSRATCCPMSRSRCSTWRARPRERPDPFGDYRAGLGLLAALPGVRHVVPGHGHVGDAAALRARVAADFRYLDHVELGADLADRRLLAPDAGWLRADHARQRELAGARHRASR